MHDPFAPRAALQFAGPLIEWRGPAPFVFVAVPPEQVGEVRYLAREASYGWGCVPVDADVNGLAYQTSLFPRGDTYLLPVKIAVRRRLDLALGDAVAVAITVRPRGGAPVQK